MAIDVYGTPDAFIERVSRATGSANLGTDVISAVAAFAGGFDQSTWTATADSNETGFPPTDALAGYWDMQHGWISGNVAYPHEFIVNMQAPRTFTNVYFTTTIDWGTLGFASIGWQAYELYVSTDGVTWGSPLDSGTLASPQGQFLLTFSSQTKQYVKLVALSAASGYSNRAGLLNFFVNAGVGGGGVISTASSKLVFGYESGYYIPPLKFVIQNPDPITVSALGAIASAEAFGTPTIVVGAAVYELSLADSITLATSLNMVSSRRLVEVISMSDVSIKRPAKFPIESFAPIDSTLRAISRTLVDTSGFTEFFDPVRARFVTVADSIALLDVVILKTSRNLSDLIDIVEEISKKSNLFLVDVVPLDDDMTAHKVVVFVQVLVDGFTLADFQVVRHDSILFSDLLPVGGADGPRKYVDVRR